MSDRLRAWGRSAASSRVLALLIGLCFFGTSAAWTFATPVSSAVDDDFHLPSIWCSFGTSPGVCREEVSEGGVTAVEVPEILTDRCFAGGTPTQPKSTACVLDSRGQGAGTVGSRGVSGRDTAQQGTLTYGPYFYQITRFLVNNEPEGSVLRIRLFNAALAATLLTLALLVSNGPVRIALACAWLLGMVPLGLAYVPSTNPVSWTIAGIGVLWAFTLTWMTADHWNSKRAWLALGGTVVAALLAGPTRRDGWLSITITLIACLILTFNVRTRISTRWWVVVGASIMVTASILRPTTTYTQGLLEGRAVASPDPGVEVTDPLASMAGLMREIAAFPKAVFAAFGGNLRGETFSAIGLNDVSLPILVPLGVFIALLLLLTWAWAWHPRVKVLALLWAVGALVTMVIGHKLLIAVEYAIQPRHLVPLLILILGISLMTPPVRRLAPIEAVAAAAAVSLASSAALIVTQTRYTGGLLSSGASEWWWTESTVWSPAANAGLGVLTMCGWAISVLLLALQAAPGLDPRAHTSRDFAILQRPESDR